MKNRSLFFIVCLFCLSSLLGQESLCSDGVDNDGDGLIDCFDSDCAGSASCDTTYFGQSTPVCQFIPSPQPGYLLESIYTTDSTNAELDQRSAVMVGDLDKDGIPEIVGKDNGSDGNELYVFSGRTGETLQEWDVANGTHPFSTVALGEVDASTPNGDIFVVAGNGRLDRFEYGNPTRIWGSTGNAESGIQSPQLADFDQDGIAEVYVGNRIFDALGGVRLVNGGTTENKGAYASANNIDSWPIAYNVFNATDISPVTGVAFGAAANGLELVAGDKVYLVELGNGTLDNGSLILASNLSDGSGQSDDGFTSIADMDGDDLIDIVVTDGGQIFVWNPRTESRMGNVYDFPGDSGGRPNIGDFDNDGDNEIGVAGQNSLTAITWNGSDWVPLWVITGLDDPSQKTGSTLFDLEGDGKNEVIYSDEEHLYVFRGSDGAELSKVVSRAGTRTEYPLVVDVDADGQAEIVVTGHRLNGNSNASGNGYITAYKSIQFPWVAARTTWNQHGYYVTNVNNDLTIPRFVQEITNPALNGVLNGFLQQTTNLTTAAVPTYAASNPRISIENPFSGDQGGTNGDLFFDICGSSPSEIVFNITVSNDGDLPISGNMPISYYKNNPLDASTNPELIRVTRTGVIIEAGQEVQILDTIPDQNAEAFTLTIVVNHNGNLSTGFPLDDFISGIGECDTTDNVFVINFIGCSGVETDSSETPFNTNDTLHVIANDANPGSNAVDLTLLSGPSNGSATVFQDTLIIYNPDDLFVGLDSIQYQLCVKDTNICDTGWAYVYVNQFPIANPDAFTLMEDNVLIADVLQNDTDADSSSAFGGDLLRIQLVNGGGANFGTATITPNDSSIQYLPNPNVNGQQLDTLDYRVCDKFGQCDTTFVVLSIDPVNDRPEAQPDLVSFMEDTTVYLDVLANDINPDNDIIRTTRILAGPTSGGTAQITDSDSILYTPAPDFFGVDTLVYEICDNASPELCDSDTVFANITPLNDAPVIDLNASDVSSLDFGTSFTEDGIPVNVADADVMVSDVDHTVLAGGIVVLANRPDGLLEGINYSGSNPAVSLNATNDTLLITGPVTPAELATILSQITYTNISQNPTPTDRLILSTVFDGISISNTAQTTVMIIPVADPPVALKDIVSLDEDSGLINLDVAANDTDPDGDLDPTSVSILMETVTANGGRVVVLADGTIDYTPADDFNGVDTIIYQICDGQPLCVQDTVVVTVNPVADPPLTRSDTVILDEDSGLINLDVAANDTDPDGDLDPTSVSILMETVTANGGRVAVLADGTIDYTPADDFNGVDTIIYQICDGRPACSSDTLFLRVNAQNDAPVATDDTSTTNEENPVLIDVLSNDLDPDGDVLSTTITGQPTNGNAVVLNNNVISYVPNLDFVGVDTIKYLVCDALNACDSALALVTVAPVNDAPMAASDRLTTTEDVPLTADVQANDTDVEGDDLTTTILQNGSNGLADVLNGDRIVYTPNLNFNGVDTVVYEVCDLFGACDSDTLFVLVSAVNDSPQVLDQTGTPTDQLTVSVAEDDTLTLRLEVIDVDGNEVDVVRVIAGPTNGTVFDLGTGDTSLTYLPNPNYNGPDTLIAVVCDNGTPQGCDTLEIAVNVSPVNDAPVARDDSSSTNPGVEVSIPVGSNDEDLDGDALMFMIIQGPNDGVASVEADGINYTPSSTFLSGADTLVYTACDGSGLCDTALVVIRVPDAQLPPVALNDTATVPEDLPITLFPLLNDSDPNNDPLTLTAATSMRPGATVSINATGDGLVYVPAPNFVGTDTLSYTVCDTTTPTPFCDDAQIILTVSPVNDSPQVTDSAGMPVQEIVATTPEDTPLQIKLTAQDIDGDALDVVGLIQGPTNGTITGENTADTTLTYTPNPDYVGNDTLIALVCDNGNPIACDTVEIVLSVSPVNDAPVTQSDSATTPEEQTLSIDVQANDTDVENDPLLTTLITNPTNGSVTIENGERILYTPNLDFVGLDTIIYQVDDGNGGRAIDTVFVTVLNLNDAPNSAPDSALTPEEMPVVIDVQSNDTDIDGDELTTLIVQQPTNGLVAVLGGDSLLYTPNNGFNGTDTIVYQVCDPFGLCAVDTVLVGVSPVNDPPVVVDELNNPLTELFITLNEDEAEPIKLTVIDQDGDPVDLTGVISGPSDGIVTGLGDSDTTLVYTPRTDFNGQDTLLAMVCDAGTPSLCDTVQIILSIAPINDRPNASDDLATAPTGTNVVVDLQQNDQDVDGDVLVTTIIEGPNKGTATLLNSDSILYTPDPTFIDGIDTLSYTVCDPSGLCDTAIVQFFVPFTDLPPVALDDEIRINEDQITVIDVLLNDFDVNGDSLFISSFFGAQNGTINLLNGALQYIPNQDFFGQDTLQYIVCDTTSPTALCDTGFVFVIIDALNDAPKVVDGSGVPLDILLTSTPSGVPVEVCLMATDVEGNSLDVTNQIDPTLSGIITGLSDGDTCFVYTPDPLFSGNDTLTLTTCDNFGACDTTTVIVTVGAQNQNPIITSDGLFQTLEDRPILIKLEATDPDNDPIDIVTILDGPTQGTIQGLNDGDTSVVYTPNPDFNGSDTLRAVVCDLMGACDTSLIVIGVDPVNDAPFATDELGNPTDMTTLSTIANTPVEVCLNGTDPDNDAIDVTSAVEGPSHGGVSQVNDGDTCLVYTPAADFTGKDTLKVTLCDLMGACDTVTIIVTVAPDGNNAPMAMDDTIRTSLEEDQTITLKIDASDPDNDPIDLTSLLMGPNHGVITGVGSGDTTLTYAPNPDFNGADTVVALLCDVFNACDTLTIVFNVTPVNDPPIITDGLGNPLDQLIQTTTQDTPVAIQIQATDPERDSVDVTDVIDGPNNGTIVFSTLSSGDTSFTFLPNPGFIGNDTLRAVVCDNAVPTGCDTLQVIVSVAPTGNQHPMLAQDTIRRIINEDELVVIEINDATDPDGDSIDLTTILLNPTQGILTGINTGDTTLTYRPDLHFNGQDTMRVALCDVFNLCDTLTVLVTVLPVNDPPMITNNMGIELTDTSLSTSQNTPLLICLMAVDPEGDLVDVSSIACVPNRGTVTDLNTGDLCLTYTPAPDAIGTDTVCVVVCDQGGLCDTLKTVVTITPTNNPPVARDTTLSTGINTPIEICLPTQDPDGDRVEVSNLVSGMGSVGGLGDGDICFGYTPPLDFEGQDTVVVNVCDNGLPMACRLVKVVIEVKTPIQTTPPIALDDSVMTLQNTEVLIDVLANDTDGATRLDTSHIKIFTGPTSGTLTFTSVGLEYRPDNGFVGVDSFRYVLCNELDACDTATVTITVIPAPEEELEIFNGVSPDGDGENDVFIIKGIQKYPNNKVMIFNRWGNLVYQQEGYDHTDSNKSWGGQNTQGISIGNDLPEGTYFYLIEFNGEDGREPATGYLELDRD